MHLDHRRRRLARPMITRRPVTPALRSRRRPGRGAGRAGRGRRRGTATSCRGKRGRRLVRRGVGGPAAASSTGHRTSGYSSRGRCSSMPATIRGAARGSAGPHGAVGQQLEVGHGGGERRRPAGWAGAAGRAGPRPAGRRRAGGRAPPRPARTWRTGHGCSQPPSTRASPCTGRSAASCSTTLPPQDWPGHHRRPSSPAPCTPRRDRPRRCRGVGPVVGHARTRRGRAGRRPARGGPAAGRAATPSQSRAFEESRAPAAPADRAAGDGGPRARRRP